MTERVGLSVRVRRDPCDSVNFQRVEPPALFQRWSGRVVSSFDQVPGVPPVRSLPGTQDSPDQLITNSSPLDLEHVVADVLRGLGLEAQVTKASGDGGWTLWPSIHARSSGGG